MKNWTLCIWISLLSLSGFTQSHTPESYDAFAREVYAEGRYDEAIEHFKRLSFFKPENYEYYLYQARSYRELAEYPKATKFYQYARNNCTSDSLSVEISLEHAQTYLLHHKYDFAMVELLSIQSEKVYQRDRKWFYLGFTTLFKEDYLKAQEYFSRISYIDSAEVAALSEKLQKAQKKLKHPNPNRAAVLSAILPGLGQTYSGDVKGAINSLVLVGGLTGLFVYVHVQLSLLDAILSVYPWFSRYYMGGTQNARISARVRRERKRQGQTEALISFLERCQ